MVDDPLEDIREEQREASRQLESILMVEEDAGLTLRGVETAMRELRDADEALARISGNTKEAVTRMGTRVDVADLRRNIEDLLSRLERVQRGLRRVQDEAQRAAPGAEARVDELDMMLGEREMEEMRRDIEADARREEDRFEGSAEDDDDDVTGLGQLFG